MTPVTAPPPGAAEADTRPGRAGRWPAAAALALAYTVAAVVSLYIARQPGSVASVWYANALAIAVFSARPRADWPGLALAVALANTLANWIWGDPWPTALSFAPPNLVEIVIAAWALQRAGLAGDLGSARRLAVLLLVGGVLPQIAGATLGAATLALETDASFERVWLPWFEGAAIGALSVLPLAYLPMKMNG
jgi:integral membrane sensor domain MASE1